MSKNIKVGLFFGSFNPCHIGHICVAQKALNSKLVDKVWFVPAKQNPWKNGTIDIDKRITMGRLMLETFNTEHAYFIHVEKDVESSYTYDVLEYIKNLYSEYEFVIITTKETLNTIKHWYRGEELLAENKFVIIDFDINIHSTDVRKLISEDKIPYPYITTSVYKYIKENGLYK